VEVVRRWRAWREARTLRRSIRRVRDNMAALRFPIPADVSDEKLMRRVVSLGQALAGHGFTADEVYRAF